MGYYVFLISCICGSEESINRLLTIHGTDGYIPYIPPHITRLVQDPMYYQIDHVPHQSINGAPLVTEYNPPEASSSVNHLYSVCVSDSDCDTPSSICRHGMCLEEKEVEAVFNGMSPNHEMMDSLRSVITAHPNGMSKKMGTSRMIQIFAMLLVLFSNIFCFIWCLRQKHSAQNDFASHPFGVHCKLSDDSAVEVEYIS